MHQHNKNIIQNLPSLDPKPAYDNLPLVVDGTPSQKSLSGWRVPIEKLTPEARAERLLEDPVQLFLHACGQFPPYTDKQMRERMRRYRNDGDMQARGEVILHNLRHVFSMAKQYSRARELPPGSMEDLLISGTEGLMTATNRYNPDHASGAKFSTFVRPRIWSAMNKDQEESQSTLKTTQSMRNMFRAVGKVRSILEQELGRTPTHAEVAERVGVSASDYDDLNATQPVLSLDELTAQDESGEWMNGHEVYVNKNPEQPDAELEYKIFVAGIMGRLTDERQRQVIGWRYGINGEEPHTHDEIGQKLDVSRERARQIEIAALARLQQAAIATSNPLHDD